MVLSRHSQVLRFLRLSISKIFFRRGSKYALGNVDHLAGDNDEDLDFTGLC